MLDRKRDTHNLSAAQGRIRKLLDIWEMGKTFPAESLENWRQGLTPQPHTATPCARSPEVVSEGSLRFHPSSAHMPAMQHHVESSTTQNTAFLADPAPLWSQPAYLLKSGQPWPSESKVAVCAWVKPLDLARWTGKDAETATYSAGGGSHLELPLQSRCGIDLGLSDSNNSNEDAAETVLSPSNQRTQRRIAGG